MQPCADTPHCGIMMVKTEKRSKNDAKRKNGKTFQKRRKTEKRKNVPKTMKNGKSTIFITFSTSYLFYHALS
jgi:hypothetical protein